ncbi:MULTISPECIES: SMI1/KNR4 family protein [Vibrio]|uniref:SMI1/KNR4 family protein n=1 Tax=Vibrio TaxID=662 RepID=UPI0022CDAA44|nr:SMI1/KNR4 family protein [Vibrio sp. MM46]MDA0126292.1 SMI1/KNR4 family protein [Vibrio sp. MM46]
MKCSHCSSTLENPDVINSTAYFVCGDCGEVLEVENYKQLSLEDSIKLFESEFGYSLPLSFTKVIGKKNSLSIALPEAMTKMTKLYFQDGIYDFRGFPTADPNSLERLSIFDTLYLVKEWELPKELLLIDGDGHTWIALDYRLNHSNPRVIVIEAETNEYLVVADSFSDFLDKLEPSE